MDKDIIKNIDDSILDNLIENPKYLDNHLQDLGYSVDELNSFSGESYKRIKFLLKGKLYDKRNKELLEIVAIKYKNALKKNQEKPMTYLKQKTREESYIFYKNLNDMTIEEIKDIIKDLNLLELLKYLEDEQKGQ